MKKSRLLIAVLAATMFVLAAFGFVACDKDAGDIIGGTTGGGGGGGGGDNTAAYTITFNYNGGSGTPASAKTVNGKVTLPTPTTAPPGKTFDAWYDAATGGSKVTNDKVYTKDTTVYAQYTANSTPGTEYDITFSAGEHGTLNGTASVKTNNGIATFPSVTADTGWNHTGWKDADGNTVTASMKFTKSTTVTAQYTEQQQQGGNEDYEGLVAVDTTADNIGYLVGDLATPGTFNGDYGVEMELRESGYGGNEFVLEDYHLNKDTLFKFRNGTGDAWTANLAGGSAAACFEIVQDGDGQDNIKVLKSGTFTFYVKIGSNGEIYIDGTADFEGVEGETMTVTVKCADGDITFNIEKVDGKSTCLYIWVNGVGTALNGAWPGTEVSDGDVVTLTDYNVTQLGLIINRGGDEGKTKDITFDNGGNKTVTVDKNGGHKVA